MNESSAEPSTELRPSLLGHLLWIGGGYIALVGLCWLFFGKLVTERVVTQLALPGGLLTLALGYGVFLAVRQRVSHWLQWVLAVCFAVYVFVGGGHANDFLFHRLQQDFVSLRPLAVEEPYDALVVLGGGLQVAADGRISLGEAGDRVVLAARMANAGKAKQLFVTGCLRPGSAMAEPVAATQLLLELGVAPDKIEQVAGANTIGEMNSAKIALQAAGVRRVGIVTSAWHMRRALRLARSCGLDVAPVPADFRNISPKSQPYDWIPNGSGFKDFGLAAKEFLAPLVGR